MDSTSGKLYPSFNDARIDFENKGMSEEEINEHMDNLVEISGTEKAVQSISDTLKKDRRRKNKAERKARKRNHKNIMIGR